MGGDTNYKQAFKTPGTTAEQRKQPIVDFAQTKNRPGRFEELNLPEGVQQAHFSYGCLAGTQFGKVERPQSAGIYHHFQAPCGSVSPNLCFQPFSLDTQTPSPF